jgi:hypothetical protein
MLVAKLIKEIDGMHDLGQVIPSLLVDSQPAIDAINKGTGRARHYDVKLKFLLDCVESRKFYLQKVESAHNLADIMTKPLRKNQFQRMAGVLLKDVQGQISVEKEI